MPTFTNGDVNINYEVSGSGFPVLLIAPGGMKSTIDAWSHMPWNPIAALGDTYQVIAMDQRNAGASTAPVEASNGWDTYTRDQLGLLDHLGIDRFHVIGMCIGGPYIMGLLKAVPERAASAVMIQPIGLDNNRQAFFDMFDGWQAEIRDAHPEADEPAWSTFRESMYGGDFMFNTSEDEVAACQTPILVLMGDDLYHPESTSRAVANLAPNATLVEKWKDASVLDGTDATIKDFLQGHTLDTSG